MTYDQLQAKQEQERKEFLAEQARMQAEQAKTPANNGNDQYTPKLKENQVLMGVFPVRGRSIDKVYVVSNLSDDITKNTVSLMPFMSKDVVDDDDNVWKGGYRKGKVTVDTQLAIQAGKMLMDAGNHAGNNTYVKPGKKAEKKQEKTVDSAPMVSLEDFNKLAQQIHALQSLMSGQTGNAPVLASNSLQCSVCGFTGKSEKGLKGHMTKMHPNHVPAR